MEERECWQDLLPWASEKAKEKRAGAIPGSGGRSEQGWAPPWLEGVELTGRL